MWKRLKRYPHTTVLGDLVVAVDIILVRPFFVRRSSVTPIESEIEGESEGESKQSHRTKLIASWSVLFPLRRQATGRGGREGAPLLEHHPHILPHL
jgi:hypothetical protein